MTQVRTQAIPQSQWDRRIRRANELTSTCPFAAEGLRFYARAAELQRILYADAREMFASAPKLLETASVREQLRNPHFLPSFAGFAKAIRQFAPEPLAVAAARVAGEGPEARQRAIDEFLRGGLMPESADAASDSTDVCGDSSVHERLLAWIFLQPFAEFLVDRRKPAKLDGTPFTCPICGSNPLLGVLRPEGDGGKKSLICMLCAHEWAFRRIYCPACGEEREPQMGFYAAPEIPHVRVDICDTCHTYVKTIELTKAGLAVPVVEELAAIALDLWAREHGYQKLQINILGT
jgi:formate dehydrogenase maturation protein FdhE